MVAREKSSAHLFLLLIFRQTDRGIARRVRGVFPKFISRRRETKLKIENRKPENSQKATLRRYPARIHESRITKTVFQRSFVI
jgi:hypothetical protein